MLFSITLIQGSVKATAAPPRVEAGQGLPYLLAAAAARAGQLREFEGLVPKGRVRCHGASDGAAAHSANTLWRIMGATSAAPHAARTVHMRAPKRSPMSAARVA